MVGLGVGAFSTGAGVGRVGLRVGERVGLTVGSEVGENVGGAVGE